MFCSYTAALDYYVPPESFSFNNTHGLLVCLSACLSLCLCVCVCLCMCLSVWSVSVCVSFCLFLCVCLSVCLSVYVSCLIFQATRFMGCSFHLLCKTMFRSPPCCTCMAVHMCRCVGISGPLGLLFVVVDGVLHLYLLFLVFWFSSFPFFFFTLPTTQLVSNEYKAIKLVRLSMLAAAGFDIVPS